MLALQESFRDSDLKTIMNINIPLPRSFINVRILSSAIGAFPHADNDDSHPRAREIMISTCCVAHLTFRAPPKRSLLNLLITTPCISLTPSQSQPLGILRIREIGVFSQLPSPSVYTINPWVPGDILDPREHCILMAPFASRSLDTLSTPARGVIPDLRDHCIITTAFTHPPSTGTPYQSQPLQTFQILITVF
jgi:hypothetical protein